MARAEFPFAHRFRVRHAEVDSHAMVFNSRYLEYADAVATEFLRSRELIGQGRPPFKAHVAHAALTYEKPIRFDEQIDGLVRVHRVGRSSMVMRIELHGADEEDRRAVIELVYVHIDLPTGGPSPWSDGMRRGLMA